MIKPNKLKKGDKIAVVSLSWGGLGDKTLIHKFYIAKERLENDFGLEVIAMPNALKGSDFVYNHPELRAKDLMDAFEDDDIKAVFCAIGGSDSVRLLPYIDYDVLRKNPKIFIGYSDSTVTHFMMNKAGVVSYYGVSIMCEFGEYVKMFDYTKNAVKNILFTDTKNYEILPSEVWSDDYVAWKEENTNIGKRLKPETHFYEVLQGRGIVKGELLGGCIDVFPMISGTEIWPSVDEWKGKILLIETSEERPSPDLITYYMRNLGAQGILGKISAIIVGKPQNEVFYEEYKNVILKVLSEYGLNSLPVMYNINIGHAYPVGVLPLGIEYELDFDNKTIKMLESATK